MDAHIHTLLESVGELYLFYIFEYVLNRGMLTSNNVPA